MTDAGKFRARTRRLLQVAFLLALPLVLAEVGLRTFAGLGHPVLMRPHPTIEYLAKPNQKVRRFGHLIEYNQFGMRSPPVTARKTRPNELRVLVIGDSVINCGATLDQSEIATTRVAETLTRKLGRPVVTLNISAGSWGPQNQLEYLNEFGLFDADLAVVELSTHDLSDVPTFGPLPRSETEAPLSALGESMTRYFLPWLRGQSESRAPLAALAPRGNAEPAFVALISKLRDAQIPTHILYHFTQPELSLDIRRLPEVARVSGIAERLDASFELLGPAFRQAEQSGRNPYRAEDPIHTSSVGQTLIADAIVAYVERMTRETGR